MTESFELLLSRLVQTARDAYRLSAQLLEQDAQGGEGADEALGAIYSKHEFVQSAVQDLLHSGREDLLLAALRIFYDNEEADAGTYLESLIRDTASRVRREDGTTIELNLLPLIVSTESANNQLSAEMAKTLAKSVSECLGSPANLRVRIGRRLRDAAEVYSWGYQDVFEQSEGRHLDLRNVAAGGLQPSNPLMWEPELRFLMVYLTWLPLDELEMGVPDASEQNYRLVKEQLKLVYGSPLSMSKLEPVYEAQETAMALYVNTVTKLSIHRQLNATPLVPAYLVLTYHCEEGDSDEDITQLRLSLVEATGRLIAGHVVELNEWLTPDNAGKIVANVCEWAGLQQIQEVAETCQMPDNGMPPFFFTGEDWEQLAPDAPRLEQSNFY